MLFDGIRCFLQFLFVRVEKYKIIGKAVSDHEEAKKHLAALKAKAGAGLRAVIIAAALGECPAGKEAEKKRYKSHAGFWFKSDAGGRELAGKVFSLGLWPTLKPQLLPFCNAVLGAVNLPPLTDLS